MATFSSSSQTRVNTSNHSENFQFGQFAIDEYRPIKVVCVGAGFVASSQPFVPLFYSFARKVPNIELTVYEKENGIGGTWFVNKYIHLQPSDTSLVVTRSQAGYLRSCVVGTNVDGSGFYASGPEILAYLKRMVEKYKFMRQIKLQHELTQASWDEATVNDTSGSDVIETVTRRSRTRGTCFSWVLVSSIPGLRDFRGRVLHSAQWDVTEEGSFRNPTWQRASTQSQVDRKLCPLKTWIGEPFSLRTMLELACRDPGSDDCIHHTIFHAYRQRFTVTVTSLTSKDLYSEKDCEAFRDEKYYKEFRHKIEADLNVRSLFY
ncbi:hypothetical protein B0F90DRAFT_1822284 [Multifurca ochricompacta]|uniref:Flavin-containing monooxygenase n=1 Tax=Multifurca ochricompacta TaxID=376703 RepID=A0AAD4QG96_9AGAM|nr:hypothetical protein B0F90DRAFT_1822284 [Multifurca ochricompacta]